MLVKDQIKIDIVSSLVYFSEVNGNHAIKEIGSKF